MLKNYFKTAWRNMTKNKVSSLINVLGLSIGITCALLILVYIQNELSFDKFHKDSSRIFQVTLNGNLNGQEFWGGNIGAPVGAALLHDIPEIESYTRFYKPNDAVLRYESGNSAAKYFTETRILAVDSNFLQLFDFQMLEGHAAEALMRPGSLVITESMARKYFGTENALGKTVLVNENRTPYIVTAILKDIPSQSSLQFDMLMPINDFPVVKRMSWSWVWRLTVCYVKLKNHVPTDPENIKQLESKFPATVKSYAASAFKRIGKPFDEFLKNGGKWDLHLLPLTRIHLHSSGIEMPWINHISSIKFVYIFGSIAVFIILLACVNFMNMSTARASKRAREIGIRKVVGSTRNQLIRQLLSETLLVTLISAAFSVVLVSVMLGPFSRVTGEAMIIDSGLFNQLVLGLALLVILISLLAGIYPAFYLTSFEPVAVLKGSGISKSGKTNHQIRNGLVIFQFTISTIIIVCTLVVFKQLRFFRNADMGFDKENVLIISNSSRLGKSEETFRNSIAQAPGILSASITSSMPTAGTFGDEYQPESEGTEHLVSNIDINSYMVDESFIPTLHIKVLKGRNFSKQFNDSASVILNEEAVAQIGWKDPIGKWMKYPGNNDQRFRVIGVVKNFNVESMHTSITPFALFNTASKTYDIGATHLIARVRPDDIFKTINQLESKWKSFSVAEPFDYKFLDGEFDAKYRSEQRLGKLFTIFTCLSIFIACLGLFGLCTYMAERRMKELGVRKVLGASFYTLVALLTRDFLRLSLIAVFIASPIAWYAMHNWLQDFAYRIEIGWVIFVIAGLATLGVTLCTISFQAIKAASLNPIKSLRTE